MAMTTVRTMARKTTATAIEPVRGSGFPVPYVADEAFTGFRAGFKV